MYWYIFHSSLSKQNWRHDGRACSWVNATVPIPSFPSREIQACLVSGINLWHVKVCKKQKSFLNCTGSPYSYQRPLPPILASTVPSGTQVGFAYQQINQHSIPQTGKLLKIKSPKIIQHCVDCGIIFIFVWLKIEELTLILFSFYRSPSMQATQVQLSLILKNFKAGRCLLFWILYHASSLKTFVRKLIKQPSLTEQEFQFSGLC